MSEHHSKAAQPDAPSVNSDSTASDAAANNKSDLSAGLDAGRLITELFGSHTAFVQQSSKLLLADARLAAASGVQLAVFAIIFAMLFVCTWIVLVIAFSVFLMWLGLSLGVTVSLMVLLHFVMLALTAWSLRSTYEGMRFKASKQSLFRTDAEAEKRVNETS